MDQQIEENIRSNWMTIKQEVCGKSKELASLLCQNGIIELDENERIRVMPNDMDQVDIMLKSVIQRKEYGKFFEILKELGYLRLNEDLTESVSKRNEEQHGQLEDGKLYYQQREKKDEQWRKYMEEMFKKRDNETEQKWNKRADERDEQWEKKVNEFKEMLKTLTIEGKTQKEKYRQLEQDYEKAKEQINEMTIKVAKMQDELGNLERELKQTQEMRSGSDDANTQQSEMIKIKKEEITNLKKEIAKQEQIRETQKAEIIKLKDTIALNDAKVESLETKIKKLSKIRGVTLKV